MAKYDVSCPGCGANMRVNIIGPVKDRQYKADHWCISCDTCIHQAHDAANQKAAQAAIEQGLPTLTGTEKQIAWAETLRESMLEDIKESKTKMPDDVLVTKFLAAKSNLKPWTREEMIEKASHTPMLVERLVAEIVEPKLLKQTSAAWWIEHRFESIEQLANRWFTDSPLLAEAIAAKVDMLLAL